MNFTVYAEKIGKSRNQAFDDFLCLHMKPLLPPRYRDKVNDPKYHPRINRWISKNGYHLHTQDNWVRLVKGKCKVGEVPTCEVIASLYIEIK